MNDLNHSLIIWINAIVPEAQIQKIEDLADGKALYLLMNQISPELFPLNLIEFNAEYNWTQKLNNLRVLDNGLQKFYTDILSLDFETMADAYDLLEVSRSGQNEGLMQIIELVMGATVLCEQKEAYINQIMKLSDQVQAELSILITKVINKSEQMQESDWELHQAKKEVQKLKNERRYISTQLDQSQRQVIEMGKSIEGLQGERDELKMRILDLEDQLIAKMQRKTISGTDSQAISRELESQLIIKESLIGELKSELKDTKKKHNQEISALKDELDLLNDKLVQASKAGSTLEMYKKRLEEMQVLKKKVADLTDQNHKLNDQLNELQDSQYDKLSLQQNLNYYKEQLAIEKEKCANLAVRSEEKDRQLQEMMKFRKDLEEKRQFLEQKNKDLLDEVEKMRYSAGSLEGECLDSFDLDLQDQIRRLEKENSDLKRRLADQSIVNELNEQVEVALIGKKVAEDKLQAESGNYFQLQEKIYQLNQQLEELRYESSNKISDLESEISNLNAEKQILNERLSELNKEKLKLEYLAEENVRLKQQTEEGFQELRKFIQDKDNMTSQLLSLKDTLHQLQTQVGQKDSEIKQLQYEATRKEEQFSNDIIYKDNQIQELRNQLSNSISQQQNQLQHDLERQTMKQQLEIQNLQLQIKERDEQIQKFQSNHEKLRQSISFQEESLQQHFQQEIYNLRDLLDQKDTELQYVTRQKDDTQRQFNKESKLMASLIHEIGMEIMRNNRQQREEYALRFFARKNFQDTLKM